MLNDRQPTSTPEPCADASCMMRSITPPAVHSARPTSGAAVGPDGNPSGAVPVGSLAHLLMDHLIPDGEIVLLLAKPSLWSLVYHSFRTALMCGICSVAATLYADSIPLQAAVVYQASVMLVFLRLLWGLADWMSRVYVLTDRRVMLLTGIFRVHISDVLLIDTARTRLLQMLHEKPLLTGNIEIIPRDEQLPVMLWLHVGRARFVQAQIVAAIHRARQQNRG